MVRKEGGGPASEYKRAEVLHNPCILGGPRSLSPSPGHPCGLWAYRHPPAREGVRIPGPPPSSSHTQKLKSERTKR